MSTGRRCSIKEAHGASIIYWQCRRRSHPVQRMGGVCAMCLTERLSTVARCAETGSCPPDLMDLASSFGHPRLAGTHLQSLDSDGIDLNRSNIAKQVSMSAHERCDHNDAGVQGMSARDSSAGSEQSIASLIERDIDEGRQRYSDVNITGLKELALKSSNDHGSGAVAASVCAKQQLARSRSYSTNSNINSKQSTPASYKINSGHALPSCGDACKFRRCNTARAEIRSSGGALLTKSKSTGSNYIGNSRHVNKLLRSPAIQRVWSLPNFWHKKFTQTEKRDGADASSSHDLSSLKMQADDSIPFMKMSRSCSMSAGGAGANFMSTRNQNTRCMGIKWFTPGSFHVPRSSLSGRQLASLARPNIIMRSSSCVSCTPEALINITQDVQDVAASSSSTAARSNCWRSLQVVDACIAKGLSVCRRWRLASLTSVSQKTARYRARTTPAELGIIFVPNDCSTNEELPGLSDTFGNQFNNLRGHKAGSAGRAGAEEGACSRNGEAGAAENDCINGTMEESAAAIIKHRMACADTSAPSAIRNSGTSSQIACSQCSSLITCTSRGECTPTLCSGNAMLRMQPSHECQSIAALVSMDAHLVHLVQ